MLNAARVSIDVDCVCQDIMQPFPLQLYWLLSADSSKILVFVYKVSI